MDYAVVAVPAAPVRRKPRHQSEMVNQLLFGDMVKILKTKGNLWVKVRSLYDEYEGWLTRTLIREVNEQSNERVENVAIGSFNTIMINNSKMHIPFGSSLPGFEKGIGRIGDMQYSFSGNYANRMKEKAGPERLREITTQWLNAPYMWGGKTMLGVDCSGFVQVNYKLLGIDLPRDAWQQAQNGKTVEKLKDALCGDLAFFDDKEEIVHVGVLLNEGEIIHASGQVRIDLVDKKGIINSTTGKRTHFLQSIKRYW